MNDELHLKCKGCGEIDSLADVDLVPRHQSFQIGGDGEYKDYDGTGEDEAYWEACTTIGVGCTTGGCQYEAAHYGDLRYDEERKGFFVEEGPDIKDIADIVIEVDGEWVAPSAALGL